jgi:hypothetical protein
MEKACRDSEQGGIGDEKEEGVNICTLLLPLLVLGLGRITLNVSLLRPWGGTFELACLLLVQYVTRASNGKGREENVPSPTRDMGR